MAAAITPAERTGRVRRVLRRLSAVVLAGALAALPGLAGAQEAADRTLETPENFTTMLFITVVGAGGVLFLASLGRLYELQRGIRWRFQDPDPPADDHH